MKYLMVSILVLSAACSHPKKVKKVAPLPQTIEEAVSSDLRTPENRARDVYRHPVETLKFFGLEPQMTVIEVSPGAGWYLEILAPYLATQGRYIMAAPVADKPYFVAHAEKIALWKAAHPHAGAKIETAIFSPPSNIALPTDASADMVLTFRNVHNWMQAKGEKQAFKAFYAALKPGGVLGVVEHRASATKKSVDPKSGYVRQNDVIKMAKAAGFRLAATSEVNANPKDTKNYPEGVWTLPPSLKLGDKDREKYLAIGESDRMTLKFVKPAK